ncbi:separin [Niveomyces insectorum RCEF 264]|uniref:separase n=1 Tax=Niveomyces insectorum RCEF 264 TaxID=1081102 RepID=A0A167Y1U2_9HYPO|nr:separin [Niveomyces insectorum RCEF 264]
MASIQYQVDAVRQAVTSNSSCTPATVVSLKALLFSRESELVSFESTSTSAANSRKAPRTAQHSRPPTANGVASTATSRPGTATSKRRSPTSRAERHPGASPCLSDKEKAQLATHVINATLKVLGEAAKPPTATPPIPKTPTQTSGRAVLVEDEGAAPKPTGRGGLRRSISTPMTPLQPRTLNRVSTSPMKPARSVTNPAATATTTRTTNHELWVATVECARIAFSALRTLQDAGDLVLPELQLEAGMSSFVAKLLALNMLDQACRELRVLKRRLQRNFLPVLISTGSVKPETTTKETAQRKTVTDAAESVPSSSSSLTNELLNYEDVSAATAPALKLIVASQLQALRILASLKKPSHIESALPFLRYTCRFSPLFLLTRCAQTATQPEKQKVLRQLESLSQLFLFMTPGIASKDDANALASKLNISPITALGLQTLGLETRLRCSLVMASLPDGHNVGDVNKDILFPWSRCLSAYSRRSHASGTPPLYSTCRSLFAHLQELIKTGNLTVTRFSKSPVASIFQTLSTMARETGNIDDAIHWATELLDLLDPNEDSAAKYCSASAQLLAFQLKSPMKKHRRDTNGLLTEVLTAIKGSLKGDTLELEELLANVCLVRKAAVGLLMSQSNKSTKSHNNVSTIHQEDNIHDEERQKIERSEDLRTTLLKAYVLQCPRFCLRWLGKPPAAKSSTKDFLRYEQRRQLLTQSIRHTLDSAFVVIKTMIDESRILWDQLDSVLSDSLTVLEYLGDLKTADAASSYHVKISHFYYLSYNTLRRVSGDQAERDALRSLRRAIDAVKHRQRPEREKAQLVLKLERMAELCKSAGQIGEALGALQSIRTSLVDDGALVEVKMALDKQPPNMAWMCSDIAKTLSRTLVSIHRLEQVHLDWTGELEELEKIAVLEHQLHFILLGDSTKPCHMPSDLNLSHPCVESLLRIYYPTRFPVRRLRTLLRLFSFNIDKPSVLHDITPQISAALGLIGTQGLGDDALLAGYLPHYEAMAASLKGFSEGYPDISILERSLAAWKSLVMESHTTSELEQVIDNITGFQTHLKSITEFLRALGRNTILDTVLELSSSLSRTLLSSGNGHDAQQMSFALEPVLALFSHHKFAKTGGLARKRLGAHGCLLLSIVALEQGEFSAALHNARNSVRMLVHDWTRMEKAMDKTSILSETISVHSDRSNADISAELAAGPGVESDTAHGEVPEADLSSFEAADTSTCPTTTTVRMAASPNFWTLFHPLFNSMLRLSSIYAHLGMFQETIYYAEQAHKMATVTAAALSMAQVSTWLSFVWLKAGKPEKSVEYAAQVRARMPQIETSGLKAALACQLSTLYRELNDEQSEQAMLEEVESIIQHTSVPTTSLVAALERPEGSGDSLVVTEGTEKRERAVAGRKTRTATTAAKNTTSTTTKGKRYATKKSSKATEPCAAVATVKATNSPKSTSPSVPSSATNASAENPATSKLLTAVSTLKSWSLLRKKDWAAALALLRASSGKPVADKTATAWRTARGDMKLAELMALAACLLGYSTEQMARDAVFSVIQDSTLSFPAVSHNGAVVISGSSVCTANDDSTHSSLAKSPVTSMAKAKAATRHSRMSKNAASFVEMLQEAQDCLIEAQTLAAVSGDASTLNRISSMLQNTVIILSATSWSKQRALGHPEYASCSVELARNMTWSREKRALLVEKASLTKPSINGEGSLWPTTLATTPTTAMAATKAATATATVPLPLPATIFSGSVVSKQFSLGAGTAAAATDIEMGRFQHDHIDVIPKDWTVLSLALTDNKHDLCITKLQAGHSPFVIRLPLERAVSRDADNEVFNFHQGRTELLEIVQAINASCHDARDMTVSGAKSAWWAEREALDSRLKELLDNVEQIWLGGFRGIFSSHVRRPDVFSHFQTAFQNILDKHLPSRRAPMRGKKRAGKAAAAAAAATPASSDSCNRVALDPRVLDLFIGLGDATDEGCDFDDALDDLLYFVVDILQFHGERNAYDEIDFDSMVVETFDALSVYHTSVRERNARESSAAAASASSNHRHTVLVLDKALHVFPWEALPCMQGQAVSRVPSLACLRHLLLAQQQQASLDTDELSTPSECNNRPNGYRASATSGAYMLNPSGDLSTTQATFDGPLTSHLRGPSWTRIVGRPPTEDEFEAVLTDKDVLLYFGHGSGAQYIRGRTVRKLERCRATALLMGCSSAGLDYNGEFELQGPVWNYMLAGCPAVVGTLWDVTDKDIDRFAGRLFEEWGLLPRGSFDEKEAKRRTKSAGRADRTAAAGAAASPATAASLVAAVVQAREAPRFRYLTAAAHLYFTVGRAQQLHPDFI